MAQPDMAARGSGTVHIDRHMDGGILHASSEPPGSQPPPAVPAREVYATTPEPPAEPVVTLTPQQAAFEAKRLALRALAAELIISPAARDFLNEFMDRVDGVARRKEPFNLREWHSVFVGPVGAGQNIVAKFMARYLGELSGRPVPFVEVEGSYLTTNQYRWIDDRNPLYAKFREARGGIICIDLVGGSTIENHQAIVDEIRAATRAHPSDMASQFLLIFSGDDTDQVREILNGTWKPKIRPLLPDRRPVAFELYRAPEFARLLQRCLQLKYEKRNVDEDGPGVPLSPEVALAAAERILRGRPDQRGGGDLAVGALDRALASCERRHGTELRVEDFGS